MDASELLKRVRRIEIKTRALSNNIFAGEYHSAFKGRGMSFAEVREYQVGDDVRDIDWNVTARTNRPHLKVYEEERELTVMLLIDISASREAGTRVGTVRDIATELCATIAFSATKNNDKIGVIFFSDRVEAYIPPKKGKAHILCIIRQLLNLSPRHVRTNLGVALEYLMRVQKRRCVAFVVSDFLDSVEHFAQPLRIASRRHDLMAVQLYDPLMADLPRVGLIKVVDAETGHEHYVDTSSRRVRREHHDWWAKRQDELTRLFKQSGVDTTAIATNDDYVRSLMNLFSKRSK